MKTRRRESEGPFTSLAFIAPALIVYAIFVLFPIFETGRLSLTNWDGLSETQEYVGLENYGTILTDARFLNAVARTGFFVVMHIVLGVGGGLALAILATTLKTDRTLTVFRTLFFLPHVLSLAVVGVLWVQIYNPDFGALNETLRALGLGAIAKPWLGMRGMALPAITAASGWHAYGFYLIIFIAGIQLIDPQLHEAAIIDGAGYWRRILSITLPSLRPIVTLTLVLGLIRGLKGFGTVWAMTRGGPAHASEIVFVYIFRTAFQQGQIGLSVAASVLFGVVTIALAVGSMRLREGGNN